MNVASLMLSLRIRQALVAVFAEQLSVAAILSELRRLT